MEQAVDAVVDLDEGAVVGEVSHHALDDRPRRVVGGHLFPGILLGLLHAQRDFLLFLVDGQHHHLDLVARLHEFARMADPLRPTHLADVHEPLDAVFEFHKRPVAHHVDDRALADRAHRVLVGDLGPRAGRPLLHAERDLLAVAVDVQHLHLDLLVDLHHLARMADPRPAHVGDVEQTVDAAEVYERTEVGDVLDHAAADLADLERFHELLLPLGPFLLDEGPAGDDNVSAGLVDLQHEALDAPAAVVADVGRPADIDLAGRQEHVDARDVDEQAALDLPGHKTRDHVVLVDALHHPEPVLDPPRLPLRERDQAPLLLERAVLELLEQHLDGVADLRRGLCLVPLVPRNVAFALVSHVDEHELVIDSQDFPQEHGVDGERGGADRIFAVDGTRHGEFKFLIEFVA